MATSQPVRSQEDAWASWACVIAGAGGAALALMMLLVDPAVPEDRYSYPFTPDGFTAMQVVFAVQHVGLLAGLYALRRATSAQAGWAIRWGMWGALAGMALLTVTELVAITAADSSYPGAGTDLLDILFGIASMTIGGGLIVAGAGVVRGRAVRGWVRVVPLLLGVYVFIPMTPALFGSYVGARVAIGGWMLGFAVLGWGLAQRGAPSTTGEVSGVAPVASR